MQHYDPDLRCVWTTRPAPNSQLNCHSSLAGRVRRLLSSAAVVFLLRLLSDGFLYSHAGVNGGRRCSFWDRCGEFLQKTTQMFLRVGILHRRNDKRMTGSCFVFFFQKDDERSAAAPLLLRWGTWPLYGLRTLGRRDEIINPFELSAAATHVGFVNLPPLPCPALPS